MPSDRAFLDKHEVLLSQVFDAIGRPMSACSEVMKELGVIVTVNTTLCQLSDALLEYRGQVAEYRNLLSAPYVILLIGFYGSVKGGKDDRGYQAPPQLSQQL